MARVAHVQQFFRSDGRKRPSRMPPSDGPQGRTRRHQHQLSQVDLRVVREGGQGHRGRSSTGDVADHPDNSRPPLRVPRLLLAQLVCRVRPSELARGRPQAYPLLPAPALPIGRSYYEAVARAHVSHNRSTRTSRRAVCPVGEVRIVPVSRSHPGPLTRPLEKQAFWKIEPVVVDMDAAHQSAGAVVG